MLLGIFLPAIESGASLNPTNRQVELSDEERAWITNHSSIRVGVTTAWPPFSYRDNEGNVLGVDIDILKIISERTGLNFKIIAAGSWDELVKLADHDHMELATGAAETPLRETAYRFTRPYHESEVVIVAREGDRRFTHLSLLPGAKIAMPRGHVATLALAKRLPSANVILTNTQAKCFEMLARKEADVTLANMFIVTQYLNHHPEDNLEICGVAGEFRFPLRLAVPRGNTILLGILDKALATISQDERDDIVSKHLRFSLQGGQRINLFRKRAAAIVATSLLLGVLLLSWNYVIRKEVRARRKAEAELREANRSIEIFSHSMSHDLRGPLRAICGFAEVLKQDYGDTLGDDGNDCLDRMTASASRIDTLARDALAYGRASRANFPVSKVSTGAIIQELIGEFPPAQREFFKVESELPDVLGNPTLLSQALGNLLSNAVKFVPKDRTPQVRVRAEPKREFVKLWVEDNGIGIASENQARIFKAFERVQNRDYEGTGIGLAILAKTVERMSGKFGLESAIGKGSRFWIQLPAVHPTMARSCFISEKSVSTLYLYF